MQLGGELYQLIPSSSLRLDFIHHHFPSGRRLGTRNTFFESLPHQRFGGMWKLGFTSITPLTKFIYRLSITAQRFRIAGYFLQRDQSWSIPGARRALTEILQQGVNAFWLSTDNMVTSKLQACINIFKYQFLTLINIQIKRSILSFSRKWKFLFHLLLVW